MIDILENLKCPECTDTGKWEIEGDVINNRISNGSISCPNNHQYHIIHDVVRLNKQRDTSEIEYLDRPLTGFPKEIAEQERLDFLNKFADFVSSMTFEDKEIVKLIGNPILFLKHIRDTNANYVIIHPEEAVLRQLHELAVRNRIHENILLINSEDAHITNSFSVNVFEETRTTDLNILLTSEDTGELIWKGNSIDLRLVSG